MAVNTAPGHLPHGIRIERIKARYPPRGGPGWVYAAIVDELAHAEILTLDPRHIEAYIRLAHHMLSSLSPSTFAAEVRTGARCAMQDGPAKAEALARSYGL